MEVRGRRVRVGVDPSRPPPTLGTSMTGDASPKRRGGNCGGRAGLRSSQGVRGALRLLAVGEESLLWGRARASRGSAAGSHVAETKGPPSPVAQGALKSRVSKENWP